MEMDKLNLLVQNFGFTQEFVQQLRNYESQGFPIFSDQITDEVVLSESSSADILIGDFRNPSVVSFNFPA
jgi:hypothetical protein